MKKIKGILPALITPVNEDGTIKEDVMRELIDYLLARGMSGLYLSGGTGEGVISSVATRKKVMKIASEHVDDNIPVIAHIGAVDTESTLELAKYAEEAGVDAISSVPPFYYKVDLEGLKQHYQRIAEVTQLPMILYNVPHSTGTIVNAEKMAELLKIDNVIGMKYTDHNLFELGKIRQLSEELNIFYGSDEMNLAGLTMGADGCIGCFDNIMPGAFSRIYDLFRENKMGEAREIQFKINKYINICLKYSSSMYGIKEILTELGIDVGNVKPPLRPLTESEKQELFHRLKEAGFFEFIN